MACLETMPLQRVHFMWQHDTRAVAQLIKECMNAHGDAGPHSQASDQTCVSGNDVNFLSLLDEWLTHPADRALGSPVVSSWVGEWRSGSLEA